MIRHHLRVEKIMINLIKRHNLFIDISESELHHLLPHIQQSTVQSNSRIINQGDNGQYLYLIIDGTVDVIIETPNIVHIATLEKDNFFGEMSCLTQEPISATIISKTDVNLLLVNRSGMLYLMDYSKLFRNHIMKAMVKRIQLSNERVAEETIKNSYFMQREQWHDRDKYGELIGESEHIRYIREQIKILAEADQVDQVISIIGETGVGKTHVAKRIHYLSARQEYPVLMISAEQLLSNEWASIVKAAQRGTLIVTSGEMLSISQLNELLVQCSGTRLIIESKLSLPIPIKQLFIAPLRERIIDIPLISKLFLQKEEMEQQETISEEALRMLTLFPYLSGNVAELIKVLKNGYLFSEGKTIQTSHLRFNSPRQPGSRPKLGLALGSGSLRGLAHIGVIKAIEESGLPIDVVAGTSAGSIIGGLYAAELTIKDIERALEKVKWNNIVQFTFPKRSIVHNEPMRHFLNDILGGDIAIENLKLPYAAVASDANTGNAYIMRQGSLSKAITASTAIPAIMRPVKHDNKTLIDGAVVHPVPAALVKSMGADLVVAVNVCAESFTKGSPKNFIKSLLNTIDIMSAKIVNEELQLADFIIKPDTSQIMNGLKDYKSYIAVGEKSTNEAIVRIKNKFELLS